MEFIIALLYIGAAIYVANQDDLRRGIAVAASARRAATIDSPMRPQGSVLSWMLYSLIGAVILFAVFILNIAADPSLSGSLAEAELPSQVDANAATVNLALALLLCAVAAWITASVQARQFVKRWVSGLYNPESSVHTTALVLALAVLSVMVGMFVWQGGISGMAEDLQADNLGFSSVVFDAILRVAVAFLGVGLAIRRTLPQSLERLGLRAPTSGDFRLGIVTGLALYGILIITVTIWAALVTPEQLREQTAAADEMAQQFNTLSLAFVISSAAAVGEEILFRGALQPVFGWIPTSIFFALLHMQYTLTPATLIIFVVSLVLGWVRMRQSTTAAIFAHFVYNFIQLAPVALLPVLGK